MVLCLKSSAPELFVKRRIYANNKKSIKAPHCCSLWGEDTGGRWIPITKGKECGKGSYVLIVFIFPKQHSIKPGLYFSRRQSLTVARLNDSRRQSSACLYFSWRLSPAQVGDCRRQSPTVVFKVQQCWTFNAVAGTFHPMSEPQQNL